MKLSNVVGVGVGVILGCGVLARTLPDGSPQKVLPPAADARPEAVGSIPPLTIWDRDYPTNLPFPGAPASMSPEQKQAVDAVVALSFAGAQTQVVAVERMPYSKAVCGISRVAHDTDVYLVALKGPFRAVIGSHGFSSSPYETPSKAYLVDATTFTSLQSFAPWPLPRDPSAHCD